MKYRTLGKTGLDVSEIGFGAWAMGSDWGKVSGKDAFDALNTAIDNGVNFVDTADVYGMGKSEKIIAKVSKSRKEDLIIATKAGRKLDPHTADQYTGHNIEKFINQTLTNLEVDSLDLVQLHCPPTDTYYKPELFEYLDKIKKKGKVKHFGVSVEKVEEGIKAIEYSVIETVQVIFNIYRQRPKEKLFKIAEENNIGIIVRVPLASGILTGKYDLDSSFPENDHRNFNRHGEAFDVGETFAGVPYEVGIKAADTLKTIVPKGFSMPQLALKWILGHKHVSTVIPGAKNSDQALSNTNASELPDLPKKVRDEINYIYKDLIKEHVHQRW